MVKPPGVFPERFVRAVGEGEQAGAPEWWGYQLRGCCRRGLGSTHVQITTFDHCFTFLQMSDS